jgi:hypothetical protein
MEGNNYREIPARERLVEVEELNTAMRQKLDELETLIARYETVLEKGGDEARKILRDTDLGKRLAELLVSYDELSAPEKSEREKWMQACLTPVKQVFEGNDAALRVLSKDRHSFSVYETDFWRRDTRRFPIYFMGQLLLEAKTLFRNKGVGPESRRVFELGLASQGLSVNMQLPDDFKADLVQRLSPLIKEQLQKDGYYRYGQSRDEKPLTVDTYLSTLIESN